jgi:DNA (cytosine-5)-methyltransferase 1
LGNSGKHVAGKLQGVSENSLQYSLADLLASRSRHVSSGLDRTHLEFFAGIGLVRYALEKHGWSVLYANDIDEGKKRMYVDQFGNDGTFDCRDIHQVDPKSLPSAALATASFPCTDLSLAGGRKGLSGKQSSAFWGFVSILDRMGAERPPIILLENVTGFLSSHRGKDFEDALLAMNRLGYTVDAFIVDATRFVPQSRKRLFVVGIQESVEASHDKGLALSQTEVRPPALARFISDHSNLNWRLRCLPRLPHLGPGIESIVEDVPDSSDLWWSAERGEYLVSQMSVHHRAVADRMISGKKWSYGTVFRRVRNGQCKAELRSDGIAGCLRTPKGGSAKQILFCAGFGSYRVRLMTPRECARLMGADAFAIRVNRDQALFGFGDAVCVPVIEWIAENYLNHLAEGVEQQKATAIA